MAARKFMYPSKSNNHHLKKYTIILLLSLYAALVWSKLHWQHNESYTNIGPKIVLLHQGPLGKKIMLYILYIEERSTHNPYICFLKNHASTVAVPFSAFTTRYKDFVVAKYVSLSCASFSAVAFFHRIKANFHHNTM